ncbi:MAG TPA: hypothetical protein VGL09_08780 [Methylomirabilota bacterium]
MKRSAALAAALTVALAATPVFAQAPPGLRLYVFSSGSLGGFTKAALQIAGHAGIDAAPVFYVIKHPRGNVLFDTGGGDTTMADAAGWWGPLATGFGLRTTTNETVAVHLARIGLTLSDIKFVVVGHARSARLGTFPNATFVVQNDEATPAAGAERGASMYYVPGDVADAGYNVVRLDGNLDLFNDRSIEIIRTSGPTPGSQFALVRLPKQGTVVLTDKNLLPRGMWSPMAMYEGYQRIRHFRDTEGASIFYARDPETFKATRQAPDYYE